MADKRLLTQWKPIYGLLAQNEVVVKAPVTVTFPPTVQLLVICALADAMEPIVVILPVPVIVVQLVVLP